MHPLVDKILKGDVRSLARALSTIENDGADKRELHRHLAPYRGRSLVVGFTGSPGAGKSTLVDQVILHLRGLGQKVGVLCVDPSSPFSGGALLGDRIRMGSHSGDSGVFIRSVSTRGSMGGLSHSTAEMVSALEAYGCDAVLIETVGVGQAELDVMAIADTVALVLTPGAGDSIQAAKAGIMEIADIFVVNKADLPGADGLIRELQLMRRDSLARREEWETPIVRTVATDADGIAGLWTAVTQHHQHLHAGGHYEKRQLARRRDAVLRLIEAAFHHHVQEMSRTDERWRLALADVTEDVYDTVDRLLQEEPWHGESSIDESKRHS